MLSFYSSPDVPDLRPAGLARVQVGVGDTLSSVALRHSMRPDQLRRWNKLLSPNIYAGQTLKVVPRKPPTAQEERAASVRKLMRALSGLSVAEAEAFLDEASGSYDRALELATAEGGGSSASL